MALLDYRLELGGAGPSRRVASTRRPLTKLQSYRQQNYSTEAEAAATTTSYVQNVSAADGATRSAFGQHPLKKPLIPSTFQVSPTHLKVRATSPTGKLPLNEEFVFGYRCCTRVFTTWYGYVAVAAASFDTPPYTKASDLPAWSDGLRISFNFS